MYGMVNKAVKGLVVENFGEETWVKISTQAKSPTEFLAFQQYDDQVTYQLVGAASEVLGLEPPKVLQTFGDYWVKKIATVHYADLMEKTGTTFLSFIQNLDHMHSRIKTTFPGYNPPSFRVKVESDDVFILDYYSEREGLLPFVEGLLNGLADHFSVALTIEHIPDDQHPMPAKRLRMTYHQKES